MDFSTFDDFYVRISDVLIIKRNVAITQCEMLCFIEEKTLDKYDISLIIHRYKNSEIQELLQRRLCFIMCYYTMT